MARGGTRALLDNDPDVEQLDVVGLSQHLGGVAEVAVRAGLRADQPQGIRLAMLLNRGSETAVFMLVYVEENAGLFSRKEANDGAPKAVEIGRLGAKSARSLVELAGTQDVLGVVYIDARPLRDRIEARVRLSAFDDDDDNATATTRPPVPPPLPSSLPSRPPPPPPPPLQQEVAKADWYPDPHGLSRLRYFDGRQWTDHTAK